MKEIDCLGEMCPIPIIKIKNQLKIMVPSDSFKVITDHSCVLQSVLDFFKKKKFTVKSDEVINGVWEIIITRC